MMALYPLHQPLEVCISNQIEELMSGLRAESQPQAQQEAEIASRPRPSPSRRRDKPQLSCNLCRSRKLRCDRRQPCVTCSKHGHTCTYPAHKSSTSILKSSSATSAGIHDRVLQLERLVMSLVPDSANRTNSDRVANLDLSSEPGDGINPEDASQVPVDGRSDHGSLHVSASGVDYVGSDHWAAILDSIADLKDHLDHEDPRPADSPAQLQHVNNHVDGNDGLAKTHFLLLYGCHQPASQAEIVAALPSKSVVDRYISRYFNYQDLVAPIIHSPTFLHEYEAFWINPSNTSIMWIGLLFGIICLAILTTHPVDSTNSNEAEQKVLQIDLYREKVVQCLILGEYTKSGAYALETVIHYVYIEFITRTDANKDIWFLLGIEVNLAKRMGYHRDPKHFPAMSPFESEMRRRVWATTLMGDVLISNQMGMPRMISDAQCDTVEPRNLNDADMDAETTYLPLSQPETEYTQTLGLIARRRMATALGAVMDLMANTSSYNYAEVMRVDNVLQEAASKIPPPLKMKPISSSLTDSPQTIMARLFINHMYLRAKIMLHQRFLYKNSTSQNEDTFAYSRKSCLDASLSILQLQQILNEETSSEGQLYVMRWRVTSIMNHQFLAATMILCSLLHRGRTMDRREDILAALRSTRDIWARNSSVSKEAKKASETVNIVLAKAGARESESSEVSFLDTVTGVDEQASQDMVGLPSLGESTLFDGGDLGFGFDLDALDSNVTLDEWALASGQGTGWWY